MKNRVKGNWVVITGATAGIGKATAWEFGELESNLVLTGRREDRLAELKKELEETYPIQVQTNSFDIRDRDACRDFVDSLEQPIDILVNNAGLALGKDPVYEANFEDWDTMIDTNVKGLLSMTRLISEKMKERDRGHIINLGSTASHTGYAGGSVYCATKHAVKAITEATKKDLHGTSVRVSMVSPGAVETEFSKVRFKGDEERADEVYEGMQPLTPQDIAEIIVFVANRPRHVNIIDTVIYAVNQSSATMIYRDDE
ncbi:SDR family NAD(P)-dependent oxidoreductase [Aliifodinibius sp. S!AR15-10]|uniref:SDR family NAD(P)-dependent oxidoreductase n=1 Tax=Aliifodinibius sp. S!AR15-10 TaxID=2950437 RepID=UPI002855A3B1|nr:SDR family NAD(P)-dependent oxidoreductase [Aliifodinibius sp. S!AR15-10]MDR8392579.1 SDR family NAD(P)-dependent oxidoreductase [Aliifodinibius sp. S!AR15-10]